MKTYYLIVDGYRVAEIKAKTIRDAARRAELRVGGSLTGVELKEKPHIPMAPHNDRF